MILEPKLKNCKGPLHIKEKIYNKNLYQALYVHTKGFWIIFI